MSNPLEDPRLVEAFTEIAHAFETEKTPEAMLWAITRAAVGTVPRCDHAGVLIVQDGQITDDASTDAVPKTVAHLQQRAGEGPCLEAIREQRSIVIDDLASDTRWPLFSRPTAEETGVRSMVVFRLLVEPSSHRALSLYSREPKAFDDNAHAKGAILAVHATIALTAARDRQNNQQLRVALDSNREIGTAMGILMAQGKLARAEAFDVLAGASQRLNVKLRRLASQVVQVGELNEEAIRRATDS